MVFTHFVTVFSCFIDSIALYTQEFEELGAKIRSFIRGSARNWEEILRFSWFL